MGRQRTIYPPNGHYNRLDIADTWYLSVALSGINWFLQRFLIWFPTRAPFGVPFPQPGRKRPGIFFGLLPPFTVFTWMH